MAQSTVPVLYMFPTSFYSQKVRLALRERCAEHKEIVINMRGGHQNDVSYLKMNPKGEVPMLRIGDTFVTESEKIIDTVNQLPPGEGANLMLLPDNNTPEGKAVATWRVKLDEVQCGNFTYGVMLHPELAVDEVKVLTKFGVNKEVIRTTYANTIKRMEQMQEKHPDLKDACQKKIDLTKERLVTFFDKDLCIKIMSGVDKLMDEVENQLQKNKSEDPSNVWLCGPNFTAADITLCVLLGRFGLVGMESRYIDSTKRPSLLAYWKAAKERPAVKQVVLNNLSEAMKYMMIQKIKKVALVAGGVGVASAGVWLAYKLINGDSK